MNKMLLNNECATYLENVPQQIFQSSWYVTFVGIILEIYVVLFPIILCNFAIVFIDNARIEYIFL